MITKLVISNYKSIGPDVCVNPGRLSVLIGPNGSGKSNILNALSFIRDAVILGLPAAVMHHGGNIDGVRRKSKGRPFDVHLEISIRHETVSGTYGFVVTGDKAEEYSVKSESAFVIADSVQLGFKREGNTIVGLEGLAPRTDPQSLVLTALGGDERFKPLVDFLFQMAVYSIFPDTLRMPQKFDVEKPMKPHGENWVSVLRDISGEDKADLLASLSKLTGDIKDLRVTNAAGYLVAEFKQETSLSNSKEKKWFHAGHQSDGTLRVAGLVTALLQKPPLSVIGIEEPELTVHPGALPMLYDYLKQAAETSQVLFTTHSPVILDVVDVERDRLIAVERIDGVTGARALTDTQLAPVKNRLLQLGELYTSGDLQLSFFESSEQ